MLAPNIRMIGDWRVLGVHSPGRGIEQMKPFARDPRDDLRRHTTPRKCFADAEEPAGARDGSEHGLRIQRLHRPEIDHFDLVTLGTGTFVRYSAFRRCSGSD